MDDRQEDVFKQYDFKIRNSYRARGAYILETDQGLKLYKAFEGSRNHIEFENRVKEHLYENGYENVDLFVKNAEENIISQDAQGNSYIVKNWFSGENCNLREKKDVLLAAGNLAQLHTILQDISFDEEIQTNYYGNNLLDLFEKHNREIKRVKGYIRDKRQKNEFEMCFLNCYDYFYEQALKAVELLKKSNYQDLFEQAAYLNYVCHGNYTYHNILIGKEKISTTNFDKSAITIQITDLYQFIRKTMEKNDWNIEYGMGIIEEYDKIKLLTKEEKEVLYILLLYPEKFWKITNFYYNGKKSWVPQRNIQKLKSIEEQSKAKEAFLNRLV